jgi:hypothetical protein
MNNNESVLDDYHNIRSCSYRDVNSDVRHRKLLKLGFNNNSSQTLFSELDLQARTVRRVFHQKTSSPGKRVTKTPYSFFCKIDFPCKLGSSTRCYT